MFVIEVPFFDLDKTFESSQMLRWKKLKDGMYVVIHKNMALKIEQQKNRLIMSCSADDFYDIWFDYFDIVYDYQRANRAIKKIDDFCHIVAVKQQGIRVIRQEAYEVLITQLLVGDEEENLARTLIQEMCEEIGTEHIQSMREAGKVRWYEFPSLMQIEENIDVVEQIFGKDKSQNLSEFIEVYFDEVIEELRGATYKKAKRVLRNCDLFDKLMIERICAYALGFKQAFVPDKIIKRAFATQYDLTCREFVEWFDVVENIKALAFLYVKSNEVEEEIKRGKSKWEL